MSCAVGLGIGAAVSVAANWFVSTLGWLTALRQNGLFTSDSASILYLAEPFLWLTIGFIVIRLIAGFTQTKEWQGPADVIYTAHRADTGMPLRQGLASIFAALISLGSGASLGQYGPIVQMGAVLGSISRKFSFYRLLSSDVFIGCGVAAAISAAFQAPIAAIIFAHEAVLRHFSARAITPIAIASITASFFGQWLFGGANILELDADASTILMQVPYLLIGGVIFGMMAIVVMSAHLKLAAIAASSGWSAWRLGGLAILVLGSVGAVVPQTLGVGLNVISDMLAGQMNAEMLILLLTAKIIAVIAASSLGFVGGFVSPSLFIGAATGGLFAICLNMVGFDVSVLMMMVAGMAALSATIVGAPIAMVMLVFELTESYDFAVAAMLSVVVASLLSHISFGHSLFDKQLIRRNIILSKGRGFIELSARPITPIISDTFLSVTPDISIAALRDKFSEHHVTEAYCIDDSQHYVGKILLHAILHADASSPVSAFLIQDEVTIAEDASLQNAIEIASNFVGESIAVLSCDGSKIKGVVTEGDLFRAYLETQQDIQKIEHG